MEPTAVITPENGIPEIHISDPIVYAHRDTRDLRMLLTGPDRFGRPLSERTFKRPLTVEGGLVLKHRHRGDDPMAGGPRPEKKKYPAIVYCPGSGFDGIEGVNPQSMCFEFAKRGYIVASIEYRGSLFDNAHYPAYAQDAKEAVRYLRANAEELGIDGERIMLMGVSSGGNAAAIAGMSVGEELFDIGDNLEYSSEVKAVISFCSPLDPQYLMQDKIKAGKEKRPGENLYTFEAYEIYEDTFEDDPEGHLYECSVSNHISADKKLPAFLCFCGDEDGIIPTAQGLRVCQKIRDCGGIAEFYIVVGGGHGNGKGRKPGIEPDFCVETFSVMEEFLGKYAQ